MGLDNPLHIAFLLIVLLLVFGAKRLPEVGRSLGSGLRGFKESLSGDAAQQAAPAPELTSAVAQPPAPAPQLTSAVAHAPQAGATPEAAPASAAGVTPLPAAGPPLPPAA